MIGAATYCGAAMQPLETEWRTEMWLTADTMQVVVEKFKLRGGSGGKFIRGPAILNEKG